MTWTTFNFSVGQILTASQMNNLYNNFASFAAKETNAPVLANGYITAAMFGSNVIGTSAILDSAVTTAKIADSAVTEAKVTNSIIGYSKLKYTSATYTTDSSAPLAVSVANGLSWPPMYIGNGDNLGGNTMQFRSSYGHNTGGAEYGIIIDFTPTGGDPPNAEYAGFRYYYMQASPPYGLDGLGVVPMFVYVLLDQSTGKKVIGTMFDPPWAYTPGTIHGAVNRGGKYFVMKSPLEIQFGSVKSARQAGLSMRQILELQTGDKQEVEISLLDKNVNMNVCPHPFELMDTSGKRILLLDPNTDEVNYAMNCMCSNEHGEGLDLLYSCSFDLAPSLFPGAMPRGVSLGRAKLK